MPGTFTIDFQDRTRASMTYEAVLPRCGDAWTEMLYHVTFCVGRTLVNLEREDQIETARQFESWLGNGFADFPILVAPPIVLVPCARFVSSFDGDVPSYVRSAYGFGLNARGLDYYGPMAAGVLLHHVHDAWDRADDLLQPVRALCRRVAAHGVDEAGHVMLVTECVTEALEEFKHRRKASSPEQKPSEEDALPRKGSAWRRAVAGVGLVLGVGVAIAWHLAQQPVPSSPPLPSPAKVEPRTSPDARKAEEERKAEEQRVAALGLEAAEKEARLAELRRLEEAARQAEIARRQAAEEQAEALRKEAEERVRLAELVRKKAEEERKAEEQRVAEAKWQQEERERQKAAEQRFADMKRQQEENERQRLVELKRQQEAQVMKPAPPPAVEKTIVGRDGAPMALVPAGEFVMGSDAEGEAPSHRVYLDAFYIDRYEVTNARYLKFVEASRHRVPQHVVDPQYDLWVGTALSQGVADLPVVNVDWADADAYCKWAGKRLPTEAEWEKAARGTDRRLYPWGNEAPSFARLNFSRRWQGAHTLQPVGSYESGISPYGAQDMAGNVWEWVSDWYDEDYYRAGPQRNPKGPAAGASKILRGGSWTNSADTVRATHRREEDPDMRNSDSGFRCARGAN